ncbi:MAG: hypothetical protein QXL97_02365 [Candidatus Aenigmatarchaeota archaeon]
MKSLSAVLEVIIAFLAILFIILLSISLTRVEQERTDIKIKLLVYESINSLTKTKNLRKYIMENNKTMIENLLLEILPGSFEIEVDIFNATESYQKDILSKNVLAIPFLIGGDYDNPEIKKLVVFVKLP